MRANLLIRGVFAGIVGIILVLSIRSWLGFLGLEETVKSPFRKIPIGADGMSLQQNGRDGGRLEKMTEMEDETNQLYDPRPKLGRKIVHIDLKGMPPRISYFTTLFPLLAKMRVTGVLVEYEDMFPYYGPLASIANKESYTRKEIAQLNILAAENNIEVIPLIQTFGHMEFALKVEQHIELREVPRYPQVLCPSNNRSLELVKTMIDQVMSLHPHISRIHIGSDEVYYLGLCSRCISRMSEAPSSSVNPRVDLFLHHVKSVAEFIIHRFGKRVLMWDDEFRQLDEEVIQSFGLGSLVDIVVWSYQSDVDSRLDSALWAKYSRLFPSIWAGSAFKGAAGSDAMVVNEVHYLANHYAWIRTLRFQANFVNFQGIILTGWQRYDHFAVLCEILGVAIPSLMCCLTYLNSERELTMERVFEIASAELGCQAGLEHCAYPTATLYDEVTRLHRYKADLEHLKNQSAFKGWAHSINLENQFSNTALVENMVSELGRLQIDLLSLRPTLDSTLKSIYPDWSVKEWMLTHFEPTFTEIDNLYQPMLRILDRIVFPVRPFVVNDTSEL